MKNDAKTNINEGARLFAQLIFTSLAMIFCPPAVFFGSKGYVFLKVTTLYVFWLLTSNTINYLFTDNFWHEEIK